jgi:hypothetical protein
LPFPVCYLLRRDRAHFARKAQTQSGVTRAKTRQAFVVWGAERGVGAQKNNRKEREVLRKGKGFSSRILAVIPCFCGSSSYLHAMTVTQVSRLTDPKS